MKYVLSDIHGKYDMFLKMLSVINFSEEDELYILGDVADRGEDSLMVYDYIIAKPNIHLLKGNHEKMIVDSFEEKDFGLWFGNSGYNTYVELMNRGQDYVDAFVNYLKHLPYIKVIDKFILVHAGLFINDELRDLPLEELLKEQDEHFCLWDRSWHDSNTSYKDYSIICGHTPVQFIEPRGTYNRICKKNNVFHIDCGASYQDNGILACLRLDDLKEFYVEEA